MLRSEEWECPECGFRVWRPILKKPNPSFLHVNKVSGSLEHKQCPQEYLVRTGRERDGLHRQCKTAEELGDWPEGQRFYSCTPFPSSTKGKAA